MLYTNLRVLGASVRACIRACVRLCMYPCVCACVRAYYTCVTMGRRCN